MRTRNTTSSGGGRPSRASRRRQALAAALAAVTLPLPFGLAMTTPAEAATPLIKTGDIITADNGDLLTNGSINKIDPTTGQRTTISAGGDLEFPQVVVSDKAGNIYVGSRFMGIVRIDRVTGEQSSIAAEGRIDPQDMALGPDGNLIIADGAFGGTQIATLNPVDRTPGVIHTDVPLSGDVTGVAVEFDGSILVLDRGFEQLVRIKAHTHDGEILKTFTEDTNATGMTLDQDSNVLVRLGNASGQQLVRIDRRNGAEKVLASSKTMGASTGMAREADGRILDAQNSLIGDGTSDGPDQMVRFAANGGTRSTVLTLPSGDINDVTVAGINQILPTPVPDARGNTYTMEQPARELHIEAAQGVLANDRDPLGALLEAETLSQSGHGFVSLLSDGSLFYFPPADFTGTDSFTYRARTADGRVSAPATVTLKVLPNQSPTAKPDFFNAANGRTTTIGAGGVLFNDSDPQGDPLTAKIISSPKHGLGSVDSDGTVAYTPAPGFSGDDTFTYQARDPKGHTSAVTTVTMSVAKAPSNNAPTVGAVKGGSLGADGLSGTFKLGVFDFETPQDRLKVTATSSNTALVPTANVTLGGTGTVRTLGIKAAPGKTGTAVVAVKVADAAGATGSFTITVKAGKDSTETLAGTEGADLLLGLGGDDTISGNGGFDLLAGGAGNDKMSGGAGTDSFRGHAGINSVSDFNAAIGETITEALT